MEDTEGHMLIRLLAEKLITDEKIDTNLLSGW